MQVIQVLLDREEDANNVGRPDQFVNRADGLRARGEVDAVATHVFPQRYQRGAQFGSWRPSCRGPTLDCLFRFGCLMVLKISLNMDVLHLELAGSGSPAVSCAIMFEFLS